MAKDSKVTVTKLATGDVYKQLGQLSEAARLARPGLGELPVVYVTNRAKNALGIVPAWVADWVVENSDELLKQYRAAHPDES